MTPARFINLTRRQREQFDDLIRRLQILDVATDSAAVIKRRQQLQAAIDELLAHADAIELRSRA